MKDYSLSELRRLNESYQSLITENNGYIDNDIPSLYKCEEDEIPHTKAELKSEKSYGLVFVHLTPDDDTVYRLYDWDIPKLVVKYPNSRYILTDEEKAKLAEKERLKKERKENDIKVLTAKKELDKAYFDALESGDMKAAEDIIKKAADISGYNSNNDWRMSHSAPDASGGYVRMSDIVFDDNGYIIAEKGSDVSTIPRDYFVNPHYYTGRTYEESESVYKIKRAIETENRLRKEGKTKRHASVMMYRGVDGVKNAKEANFRNGDWITPSRDYAKNEAENSSNSKPRIIAFNTPLNHIWWDVNSICEFGYDNELNYSYGSYKNNRKLLDVVVKDSMGRIIPPSKRFNYKKTEEIY